MTDSVPAEVSSKRTLSRAEFQEYSPLIRKQAIVLARRAPPGISVSDLCVRGFSGLFEALGSAKALAPDMDLHEYVMARVRNAMVEQIQMANPGVAEVRAQSRQVARAMKLLGAASATSEAIAGALKLTLPDYDRMLQTIWEAGIARIEVLPFDSAGPVMSSVDTTPVATLAFAVEALPQQCQRVLMLVYQADCSLAEAASVLGWSESRAITVYTEAIHRVRALIGKE